MTESEIKLVVKETVTELLGKDMIKYSDIIIVDHIGELLKSHYAAPDDLVSSALDQLKDDEYFEILEGYYGRRMTLERLAELHNADISTIFRNKKRLCLKLFKILN